MSCHMFDGHSYNIKVVLICCFYLQGNWIRIIWDTAGDIIQMKGISGYEPKLPVI